MTRRVVVTGLGTVSPLGTTIKENWDALVAGKSGIGPVTSLSCPSFPVKTAGEVKLFKPAAYHISPKSLKVMNKTIQYAIAASFLAVKDAALSGKDYASRDMGLYFGVNGVQYTGEELLLASYESVNKDFRNYMNKEYRNEGVPIRAKDPTLAVHPLWPLSVLANMSLCHIAIQHDFQGSNIAFSSIDAAGSQAIGEAFEAIRHGAGNIVVAGGSYALNTIDFMSMAAEHLLSQPPGFCRPFDRLRDGCVPGEGSAVLVLEELSHAMKRGAHVYAEIIGYGSFFNGKAGCGSDSAGGWQAMRECMQQALHEASLSPADIDYINADGKGSVIGDVLEARAVHDLFGGSIPVSTSKPLTGHMLPASGAFEALATVLAVRESMIPPTVNCTDQEPECNLYLIKNALKKQIKYAISNSFGFSGEHTTVIFKHYNQ
jgi:3-oxoacyl-[acyl-carrier-protein] synthase II